MMPLGFSGRFSSIAGTWEATLCGPGTVTPGLVTCWSEDLLPWTGCGHADTASLHQSQRQDDGVARLKRVVLIGDHHQLPPVVKNMAFQKFSHLDQSLFTRFVRLGTPYIQLNAQVCRFSLLYPRLCLRCVPPKIKWLLCIRMSYCNCPELRLSCQGRARPSLAKLYNWRYHQLGDLPNVTEGSAFLRANPGFALDFQFVDVPDYQGAGESAPVPYFYQVWLIFGPVAHAPTHVASLDVGFCDQSSRLRLKH